MHDLKSPRNTSRVLTSMSEYLCHFRDGENIYYLSTEGRMRVGSEVIRKKSLQIKHFIMRNQVYLYYGCPADWMSEVDMVFKNSKHTISITSDATFTKNGKKHIVEVDNLQKMSENLEKIKKYKTLISNGAFGLSLPTITWATTTEIKKRRLTEMCKENGLICEIYTFEDLNSIL